jgi:hypothetical protein
MTPLPPMSSFELKVRKTILFFWSPVVFIPTRLTVVVVFFADFADMLWKWWFVIPFLVIDFIAGLMEMARRIPRWLQRACARAKAKLAHWSDRLQITADRADRIFDESIEKDR